MSKTHAVRQSVLPSSSRGLAPSPRDELPEGVRGHVRCFLLTRGDPGTSPEEPVPPGRPRQLPWPRPSPGSVWGLYL